MLAAAAALKASDPRYLIRKAVRIKGSRLTAGGVELQLSRFRRILVVGGGKASGLMAVEAERILGDRIAEGVVVVPEWQRFLPTLERVHVAPSTHPLPTEKGVRAVKKMLGVLRGAGPGDLVVCLISGGGSSLMPLPTEGVSIGDLKETTRLLLRAGAEIGEINCVRKHLSQIAGGRLVEKAGGAEVLSLIISDVVGDDLSSVASGPTLADPTTFAGAAEILTKRGVWVEVPSSVRSVMKKGVAGRIEETPKPGSALLARVHNVLVGSNGAACRAAGDSLCALGYTTASALVGVTGEARTVGRRLARLAASSAEDRWAAVWGGETTVRVRGSGVGGRNQELALAAAMELRMSEGVTVLSFGTDGVDGPTNAAGAVADSTTYERGRAKGLDAGKYLKDNDSHSYFEALGDLVVTGPTGTNVNDVMVALRIRP